MNKWVRPCFAGTVLAILLRIGLGIPILTTFVSLAIIYVMHLLMTEMGSGVQTALKLTKSAGNMLMGVVIFLALRFLAAKALGLYPASTYDQIDSSGGFRWILPGYDISSVILWEVMFAFVAGGLSVAWVKGQHRKIVVGIFAVSLLILSLQLAFPKYTATWASKDQTSRNLTEHGVVGASVKAVCTLLFGQSAKQNDNPPPKGAGEVNHSALPEFPQTGDGVATKAEPIKAWLDPNRTHTRPSGPARYVLVGHPSVFNEEIGTKNTAAWRVMPAGEYLVYPIGTDEVYFHWWQ